jgi:hypothetical protein
LKHLRPMFLPRYSFGAKEIMELMEIVEIMEIT